MKKAIIFLSFVCIFNIISCSDDTTNPGLNSVQPIIYVNENLNTLVSDSISISHIDIKNNILIIDYRYLGGCGDHQINLFAEMGFEETSPVQLNMRLVQHSFSDTCQNVINGKAYFDLRSAASLFKSAYHGQKGVILLTIYSSVSSGYYMPLPRYEF